MNPSNDECTVTDKTTPLPFLKPSVTRWLVRGKVMYNILVNWDELLVYFTVAEQSKSMRIDARCKARLLKEILLDKVNHLYFSFATPIVQEFEKVNALFLQTSANPHELSSELIRHHQSLLNRLYLPNGSMKSLGGIDFGLKFLRDCTDHFEKYRSSTAHHGIQCVKERCQDMLREAVDQIGARLPSAHGTLKNLSKLSPKYVLSQILIASFAELPFDNMKYSQIEEQYRKIVYVDWRVEPPFNTEGLPVDAEKFWFVILHHSSFKDLAAYALNCLITPISNAAVERMFSLVTARKTKPRNRMQVPMLDSIARIRSELIFSKICCKDFVPSPAMLRCFKWNTVHCSDDQSSGSDNVDDFQSFL